MPTPSPSPERIVRRDPRATYTSHFALQDRVHVDDDTSITGVVTGLMWTSDDGYKVEVSWLHSGQAYTHWFQFWRLTLIA